MIVNYPSLYHDGVPIKDATVEFAPELLKRQYRLSKALEKERYDALIHARIEELNSSSLDRQTKERAVNELRTSLKELKDDPAAIHELKPTAHEIEELRSPRELLDKMRAMLAAGLREGKYVPLGFPLPRGPADPPQRIPDDVLQVPGAIDWDESTIAGNGLEFTAVRVLRTETVNKRQLAPRKGRRTRKSDIVAAYEALRKIRKIQPAAPRKVVCNAVHKELVKRPEDDWGLADDTIWRHVQHLHRPNAK